MNRAAKLAYTCMMALIVSYAIAAPIDASLLPGISGKKGIGKYIHKKLLALRNPFLSYSTLDALKKRLYQKRYYLAAIAALLAVGGGISFSTNQKNRKLDRYSELTGSLMEQPEEQGRDLIYQEEEEEQRRREEQAKLGRSDIENETISDILRRMETAQQRGIEEQAELGRREIENEAISDILFAEYRFRQQGQRIAEETDDYIRRAKELGVAVWKQKDRFRPILFSNYPSYVLNDPIVQRLWRAYTLKRGNNHLLNQYYSNFGDHDGFFGLFDQGQCACTPFVSPNVILTTLTHALSNKDAKQALFCSIVRQFQKDKESLGLDTSITYNKQDSGLFFLSSNSPDGTNLLDSRDPAYQTNIIPYKGMVVKHEVNLNPTNDSYPQDELEEVCFGRGDIVKYYLEVPEEYIKKTLFGTCPGMGVAKKRTDRRLFEAVLYLLIQQVASDPAILSKFIGKKVVADSYRNEVSTEEFAAVYEFDEENPVGKNRIGKMITYAIQQILLPGNRELLNAVIAKHYRFHALMVNRLNSSEMIPKGAMPDLLKIIFSYYLPTPAPEVKPVSSRISPPQGQ